MTPLTLSLKEALKTEVPPKREETAENQADEPDEAVEKKLVAACEALEQELAAGKRRLALAFVRASVEGNCVRLVVPGDNLKKEVETHAVDLKRRLAELAGIRCPIEFEIRVDADAAPAAPVSPEDKLRHLAARNEHLAAFKKALDLDLE